MLRLKQRKFQLGFSTTYLKKKISNLGRQFLCERKNIALGKDVFPHLPFVLLTAKDFKKKKSNNQQQI